MSPLAKLFAALVVAGVVVAVDAKTKSWANEELRRQGPERMSGQLTLQYRENRGIVFGLLRGESPSSIRQRLIVGYSFVVSAVATMLLGFQILQRRGRILGTAGLTLLVGGTVGNLYDRIQRGYVIDFISFSVGRLTWPTFNIADVVIAAGIGLCVASLVSGRAR